MPNYKRANRKPRAKKHLGQNFLINKHIIDRIITSCELKPSETILEIGPGLGALTKELSLRAQKVIAVEKDRGLSQRLKEQFIGKNVETIEEDILKFSFSRLPPQTRIIANLPYYITTPIIEKIISERDNIRDCFLTVQLEVGERITAPPGSKEYGSLTLFVNYFTSPKMLFKITNTAFSPVPKVQSCFIYLDMKKSKEGMVEDEDFLFKIIHSAFQQRRKTILNSLSSLIEKKDLQKILSTAGIRENLRAENLSMEDFINLYGQIKMKIPCG
ncbi:MAG: ribosomal RNA small subunit methyltransferase A [Candidatus Omnitrophica bacterium]|nr:ribosomal RNA small subunit methyltransferase A [Candidatus Omnitrophota bacterium]